jgi:uncharacterized protein
MNRDQALKMTEDYVRQNMTGYDSGHDWWHIERVRKLSLYINSNENIADPYVLEIVALLHDTVDSKFAGSNTANGYKLMGEFLERIGLAEIKIEVIAVLKNISFSNRNPTGNLSDPILLIVQDADRLDAIGAIGIARAFNYGGFKNNPIYVPDDQSDIKVPSTINHFYDKLLRLKDMMNTTTGRRIAEERHLFLKVFLEQFYKEWEFGINGKN